MIRHHTDRILFAAAALTWTFALGYDAAGGGRERVSWGVQALGELLLLSALLVYWTGRQRWPDIGELSLIDRLLGWYDARCADCQACVGNGWPWWRGKPWARCARCERLAGIGDTRP